MVAAVVAFWWWRSHHSASTQTQSTATSGAAQPAQLGELQRKAGFTADRPIPGWFARPGTKPRRIAGKVTRDKKPAAGATVTLQSMLTHAGFGSPVEVKAGADGRFDLGEWPAGGYIVSASAPDTTTAIVRVDLANPTQASDAIELDLKGCTLRISGTITDASNAPLVDALVRRDGVIVARTNAQGVYKLCAGYGNFELDYSADNYGAVVIELNVLGDVVQDVVLLPEVSIVGHVVRMDDGKPVANAFVNANPSVWGRARAAQRPALTDSSGAFRIDGLTPGSFGVWAFADGMTTEQPAEVQAYVGKVNEVTLRLVDLARIDGVVTRSGKALPNVAVSAVRKTPQMRPPPVWTRDDGSFSIHAAPIGDLVFAVEGYEVISPTSFRVDAAKPYDGVKIEVAVMARIHGTVTRNKIPVEGAMVWGPNAQTTTDSSGHYEFVGLPPGTYQIGSGSDDVGAFTIGTKVTVAAGEDKRHDLELELAGEIAGTVVDAKGQPVPGVFVRWSHLQTQDEGRGTTDAMGNYRCRAMQGGGTYEARVFATPESGKSFPPAPGTTYPKREVKDGTSKIEGVTIAIDYQKLTIAGRVTDATGAAVVDATVSARATESTTPVFNTWQRLPSTATDADGSFTLRDLPPGIYAVKARSPDGGEAFVTGIAAGTAGVTIKLTRPGSLEGTLAGFVQPPSISATPWNQRIEYFPGTVQGTRFTITGLRPGRYIVNAQNMTEGDAKIVEVRAGEKASVTLLAKGRGQFLGSVIDYKTRKPLIGAICRAVMAVDGQQGLTAWDPATAPKTDESGRVVLDPTPAGDVTVVCMPRQGRYSTPSVNVTVPPGGRAEGTLLAVEMTVENPGTTGAEFNWEITPPRIAFIEPNSSAAKAGLAVGDLVVAVDGANVDGLNGAGVGFLIVNRQLGASASVTVQRGTVRKTVTVEVEQNAK